MMLSIRNDYLSTPVTTSAYTQLSSALPANVRELQVFDSSGSTLTLAYGPPGSEVVAVVLLPGASERTPCILNAGQRLSIKAVDVDATNGELVINGFY